MLRVIPAYGRDYPSARALREDWIAGKDFRIADMSSADDGRVVNRQDYPSGSVQARYRRLTQVVIFESSAELAPARAPRRKLPPAPICAERFCGQKTRRKSGYCARHDSPIWRRIRARRALELEGGLR